MRNLDAFLVQGLDMPKSLKGSISAACCLADLRLIGAKFVNYNNCILSNVITMV